MRHIRLEAKYPPINRRPKRHVKTDSTSRGKRFPNHLQSRGGVYSRGGASLGGERRFPILVANSFFISSLVHLWLDQIHPDSLVLATRLLTSLSVAM
jgi:hypothetical protein